jgi:hypothetical protein
VEIKPTTLPPNIVTNNIEEVHPSIPTMNFEETQEGSHIKKDEIGTQDLMAQLEEARIHGLNRKQIQN